MRRAFFACLPKLGERGNVALMTAIIAPLLLLVGGFAVDYGYASYINQRLSQATDDAVLGSVSQSAATAGGGFSNTSWLQTYGTNLFKANVANLPISNVKFTLNVTSNGTGGVNSVGSYTYDYPTFFAGVIGISTMPLKSQIKASANPVTYLDYYIVVDVSQSMGIGATLPDMQKLYDLVVANGNGSGNEAGCVFGCHVMAPGQHITNEQLAHSASPRINLRIDAAVSAIQSIISDAQAASGTNKNIRIGMYTISRDPNKPGVFVNVIAAPSTDYTTLNTQANLIDLGGNISAGAGDTDYSREMVAFNTLMPLNGSGASAITPQNYVFLITDGLSDASDPPTCGSVNCHPTKAFDPNDCKALKLKATVGTIYTTYNPIYNQNKSANGLEGNYNSLVAPFVGQIANNLKTCSSDSSKFAFEAQDGPGINTAMRSLFASTLQNARLTQ